MKIENLLNFAKERTGISHYALMWKKARVRNNMGNNLKDILGWDFLTRAENNTCYEFYAAQPPLIGMTQPQPVNCPLGIVPFNKWNINIDQAINIFHQQNGGDYFTEVTLSWPLVHPEANEPYWHFRTNLGNIVVIGANTGQFIVKETTTTKYFAQN